MALSMFYFTNHGISKIPKKSLTNTNDMLCIHVKDKTAGPDGINMKAFIYRGFRVDIHLCLLFNIVSKLNAWQWEGKQVPGK